ncbi:major facilitator superfamily domain-containing protein [Bipolaris maydis]|uniref:major facilitator superfamily domain-containing protein n=1 Tax=Cochliobolus heterostrophus TaxID=5016 RepID=UPI0024D91405|nr:major facilitator superfamily domain-containing protein [Bipolaris maydis]KAJ6273514.1 major facilitator superfamily domain-containing protein [Bipolaris maydis]KAJ6284731.1 major facilitator superfamily domain-containing protein [Bipolaris maydis]
MSSTSSWAIKPRPISRRFTTLEGWRELGNGVYVARNSLRIFAVENQFDPESYNGDHTSWTHSQRSENGSLKASSWSSEQDWMASLPGEKKGTVAIGEIVEDEVYHVFGNNERWGVVAMIGVAGLFSGLSSNIFFPSLDAISQDLKVSLTTVSLTITSYLIIQGISPLFWGSLSDTVGRRPIYIYSFVVYIIANIGLSFSPDFLVLLIFRGLQAAGSASTVSIGMWFSMKMWLGYLRYLRNFRSIFVFLLILSSIVLIAIIIFLPETLHSIAGNGSLRLTGIHQPLIRGIQKEAPYMTDRDDSYRPKRITLKTFAEPLLLLTEKDILLSLIFGGTVYAIWSMVTSSTTGLFKQAFGLNELLLGLVFLPNGLGTIVGSMVIGSLMNKSYMEMESKYKETHGLPADYKLPKKAIPADFPIEHARLRHTKWITVIFVVGVCCYGFSLALPSLVSRPGWIAVPLTIQFLIAATSNAIFAVNQTMVSDLCPGKGASSTAINNLVRCSMGAVGVAFIEKMIMAMGVGSAFLGLGLAMIGVVPLAVVQWYWGPEWRRERIRKNTDRKEIEK